jgi:hypothetical protein
MLAKKLLSTAGNALEANYIEEVFSTYLYKGNGSTQTITNDIDLAGKGGLVWIKQRTAVADHQLNDTARGATYKLTSNTTAGQSQYTTGLTAFNADGFSIGTNTQYNNSAQTFASWTFRKQPKFFDVVTYTGNGTLGRTVTHDLGSVPGCVIVKRTDVANSWAVYHRAALGGNAYLFLNSTAAATPDNGGVWGNGSTHIPPTSTGFTVAANDTINASGGTYVAYLFAHNAGGFGLTGTDNVISCGSFTTDASGKATVDLGWEPQFILDRLSSVADNWRIVDASRDLNATSTPSTLKPNSSNAEAGANGYARLNATGFSVVGMPAEYPVIYIAIRKGPMKVPTDATKVFSSIARTGTSAAATVTGVGFAPDLVIPKRRTSGGYGTGFYDRLRGKGFALNSARTDSEFDNSTSMTAFGMDGISVGSDGSYTLINTGGVPYINNFFRRAPSFFDEVCYTGSNGYQDLSHNLGVTPQMIIIKNRANVNDWNVGVQGISGTGKYLVLNSTAAVVSNASYYGSPWTSTTFLVDGNLGPINQSGSTYVAYLFASCPGVSKVGSYTGNGSSQTIGCGFTGGARFILIKRTDAAGDWYVWDTARGIVSGNDPHLSLNDTAAEVTTDDSIDPASTGFIVNQLAATNINVTSASYIFLAIA